MIRYRLKAQDNRRVPEAKLTPNIAYHPDSARWLTLKIGNEAEPLRQQEVVAQRDEVVDAAADRILVLAARRTVDAMQQHARRQDRPGDRSARAARIPELERVRPPA